MKWWLVDEPLPPRAYLRGDSRTIQEAAALLEPAGLTMADLVEVLPTARRVAD